MTDDNLIARIDKLIETLEAQNANQPRGVDRLAQGIEQNRREAESKPRRPGDPATGQALSDLAKRTRNN